MPALGQGLRPGPRNLLATNWEGVPARWRWQWIGLASLEQRCQARAFCTLGNCSPLLLKCHLLAEFYTLHCTVVTAELLRIALQRACKGGKSTNFTARIIV